MDLKQLKQYAKDQTKSSIDDALRRGYVEIECDPLVVKFINDRSNIVEEEIETMEDGIKELTNNIPVDVNLLGFDFRKLSKIGAADVGKIVKVRGLVTSTRDIKVLWDEAVFRCRECQETTNVIQLDPFKLTAPIRCEWAKKTGKGKCGGIKFDMVQGLGKCRNTIKITIQETPEDTSGQIPTLKNILIYKESLLHRVKCGDYVSIIGIIKLRVRTGEESRFGEIYIEANNLIVKRKDVEVSQLSQVEIDEIIALSKQPNIYQDLIFNIAPSLHGLELEKESILLALVGGSTKNQEDVNIRNCIHILLVGDPSTGKSQLLVAASNLAPLGIYSSGKMATSAGLTAAVIRDEKEWVIAAGVMVLADKGVACIDEIDKMNPDDRVAMHEAMEQQTVSIDKANIHTKLTSRTTVISAANPILGRYDENKTIADNIKNLPATLLSRFDLIMVVKDLVDEEKDKLLVKHILTGEEEGRVKINRRIFKNYLIYAKQFNPPALVSSDEAYCLIDEFYRKARKRQSPNNPISISARQLQSLDRIAEAHARLNFRNKIEVEDAEVAIRMISESLRQTCKFQTSQANINNVNSPMGKTDKEVFMMDILKEFGGVLEESKWKEVCMSRGIPEDEFPKLLIKIIKTDPSIILSDNFYPPIWKAL